MKIHEYQAKEILAAAGISVPRGRVARTPEEAEKVAAWLGGAVVVKAQIHAGGRGKAGGIKKVAGAKDAGEAARALLGQLLVTPQTGPAGRRVNAVLVEEATLVSRELYFGLLVDRAGGREGVTFLAAGEGGMNIEELARQRPEAIIRAAVHPARGFSPFHGRKLAFGLGLAGQLHEPFIRLARHLYNLFVEKDLSLLEINPLVVTDAGVMLALDAKMVIDDDALFRHPELKELRDWEEEEPLEVEAIKAGVNYVKLDGRVGCMVNGAGLAMTTMDLIKMAGGEPANFLDVGGGASAERIESAFRIIMADPKVEVILVNIFGGILRCDRVASGVVEAARNSALNLPLVVRLQGTNVEEGRRILAESGLVFVPADELMEAAAKAVALCRP
jgi:succinyl-CoA synthetase beta subunit